ncbi:MAG TPA: tetratricopeptide repeat protein [Micropepsaceae bacterium]|jgi:predicted O-linked N-acetylglucosamine transferase (SPINDLY family)|nr:tetratricopeptide repeat protein [Micropepsaceae bacterium]
MNGALLQTALGLQRAGKLDEAARLYEDILRSEPAQGDALYLLGSVHFQRGAFGDALDRFDSLLAIKPGFREALAARGATLSSLGRHEEALAAYEKMIAAHPTHAQSWNNRGNTLLALGREKDAVASYDRALGVTPNYFEAWRNRATALAQLGRLEDALTSLEKALQLKPDFTAAWEDCATVLMRLGRRQDTIRASDRALALNPDSVDALYNRGNAHAILNHFDEAIRDCEAVLARDPDYPYARGVLVHCKLQSCNWRGLNADIESISKALAAGKRSISPFNVKALSDSPSQHLRAAQIWMEHNCPPAPRPLVQSPRIPHKRIRLAYVSGEFHNGVVANVMADVFEHHDRNRFETIAVSFGPTESTPIRRRLENAFDRFIDAQRMNDSEIAGLLRDIQADIAIDLMGYTGQCRSAIFALRPVPVQVNYLGFPGTMAAPYLDYILADATVIPEDHKPYYTERVVHLPHCYLPFAQTQMGPVPERTHAGLPASGFVFASFNNSYKFNPAMFDCWMRLLHGIDGSVLWLREHEPAAKRNLMRAAEDLGVAPQRLVFAPAIADMAAHLARLSLADLFLDTHPYNAHSSAVDTLWAGVPVLTLMGASFAGRVAASALKAAGLPELIAETPAAYEAMALNLARDPAALGAIRAKLAGNRATAPLFDTARFTRHLEAAYASMWERAARGESPASFAVAAAE